MISARMRPEASSSGERAFWQMPEFGHYQIRKSSFFLLKSSLAVHLRQQPGARFDLRCTRINLV